MNTAETATTMITIIKYAGKDCELDVEGSETIEVADEVLQITLVLLVVVEVVEVVVVDVELEVVDVDNEAELVEVCVLV